jgi:uncharacterized membrane protein YjfL (UPF0719 family)|tara:strand:+ start:168 stop:344 length:177 start_codon:yes stop_codon:yes gene_type:complete
MKEEELISNLVLISFTCLWFIVLFMFGLLVYQSVTHQNQIDELIKSNAKVTSLWMEEK